MIFKLQRPLFSTVPNAPVLAYDQKRRHTQNLKMTKELRAMFGDKAKIFCECTVTDGVLAIGAVVHDRGW